jgi:hypothetical protein
VHIRLISCFPPAVNRQSRGKAILSCIIPKMAGKQGEMLKVLKQKPNKPKLDGFLKVLDTAVRVYPESTNVEISGESFLRQNGGLKNKSIFILWEIMKGFHNSYYTTVAEGRDELPHLLFAMKNSLKKEQYDILEITKILEETADKNCHLEGKRFTPGKRVVLRRCFEAEPRPKKGEISMIARRLKLTDKQVRNWVSRSTLMVFTSYLAFTNQFINHRSRCSKTVT